MPSHASKINNTIMRWIILCKVQNQKQHISIMIYTQKQSSNVKIMRSHASLEVAKTVLEVADVAWTAIESHHRETPILPPPPGKEDLELESLRSENQRLRNLLQQNLTLFRNISSAPSLLQNCPPDVQIRTFTVFGCYLFIILGMLIFIPFLKKKKKFDLIAVAWAPFSSCEFWKIPGSTRKSEAELYGGCCVQVSI